MKIKSLLLGSAAASMLAATGAQAADPIVYVEPEPMEYVRICDVYGAGFFYIPGTETCLQISGFARYQIGATNERDIFDMPDFHGFSSSAGADYEDNEGWQKNARLRINFDARNETEWGTLRSFLRIQSDIGGAGDGAVGADQVYMEFAGFLIGYTESLWFGHGGFSDTGMSYGYQQRNQVRYTFAANGFAGAVSLEHDNSLDYMPDVVGELSFTQGWGSVLGTVGYDDTADGFGAALSATVNVGATGGRFRVSGFYSENAFVAYAPSMVYEAGADPDTGAAEWSVLAAYSQPLTETLTGIAEYQYLSGHADNYQHAALGSLVWTPISGLEIRSEVAYVTGEDEDGDDLDGIFSGFLRFQRNF